MIKSIKYSRTQALYQGKPVREWQSFYRQAERRLRVLDAADRLETLLLLPSNRFKALGGKRKGQFSIRINDLWRVYFTWPEGADGPIDVEIVDYH